MIGKITQAVASPFIVWAIALSFLENPQKQIGPMKGYQVAMALFAAGFFVPLQVLFGINSAVNDAEKLKEEVQQK